MECCGRYFNIDKVRNAELFVVITSNAVSLNIKREENEWTTFLKNIYIYSQCYVFLLRSRAAVLLHISQL